MKLALRTVLKIAILHVGIQSFSQRTITGRVLDADTKKPIKQAKVKIEGKSIVTETNHLGFFQMTVDSADIIDISIADYETLTFSPISVDENIFQIELKRLPISIYQGSMQSFYEFLGQNLHYPNDAKASKKQGYVYVSFQIDSIGGLKEIKVRDDVGGGCGKMALRVFERMSKKNGFIPDVTNSIYILPIRFRIAWEDKEVIEPIEFPNGKWLNEIVLVTYPIQKRR